MQIKDRIRGYLPVVIDIETGGFNDKTDAMLEICAITIKNLGQKMHCARLKLHAYILGLLPRH
jgi:ribonuclease T